MKSLSIVIFLSFYGQFVQAQSEFDMQVDPKKIHEYLNKHKSVSPNFEPSTLQLPSDTARYSHIITQGTIYALPQDNMPCLVPDENAYGYNEAQVFLKQTQPYLLQNDTHAISPALGNHMFNAYRGKPLVWEKKP